MVRLLLGLFKGALVGALVGVGATKIGVSNGILSWVAYGIIGALVGVVCGKPLWRQETLWTPALKAVFGFLVGLGLAWVGRRFVGQVPVPDALATSLGLSPGRTVGQIPAALGALIGAVYGIFVEIDDGGASRSKPKPSAASKPKR